MTRLMQNKDLHKLFGGAKDVHPPLLPPFPSSSSSPSSSPSAPPPPLLVSVRDLHVLLQVILKPAEATPLTALALAELGRRAGLPPGVLNIVVGEAKKIGKPSSSVNSLPCMPNLSSMRVSETKA